MYDLPQTRFAHGVYIFLRRSLSEGSRNIFSFIEQFIPDQEKANIFKFLVKAELDKKEWEKKDLENAKELEKKELEKENSVLKTKLDSDVATLKAKDEAVEVADFDAFTNFAYVRVCYLLDCRPSDHKRDY